MKRIGLSDKEPLVCCVQSYKLLTNVYIWCEVVSKYRVFLWFDFFCYLDGEDFRVNFLPGGGVWTSCMSNPPTLPLLILYWDNIDKCIRENSVQVVLHSQTHVGSVVSHVQYNVVSWPLER